MRSEEDFEAEIQSHITLEADRLIAEGMAPEAARAAAIRKFGNVTIARERFHHARRVIWFDDFRKDLQYSARALRRQPGFAVLATLTLALGVGANTAIFGVVYQTLLKPLPFDRPEQLVTVATHVPQFAGRFPKLPVAPNDFLAYRRSNTTFAALSVLRGENFNLTGNGEPERLHGARVSSNFFSMLGVRPVLGRDFLAEEEQEGKDAVVLISHALWQGRFAADPTLVNQTISLDGRPHTVVGVMPADLLFPTGRQLDPLITFGPRVDIWKPAAFARRELAQEGNFDYAAMGRLGAGVTAAAAQQDIDRVARLNLERIKKREPEIDLQIFSVVTPLHEAFAGELRQSLLLLGGAVGILLLIAWVNLANLLLVRIGGREQELSTRAALGAGRGRLVRQMLTESLTMTIAGGVVGVACAAWAGRLLILYGPRTAATRDWSLEVPVIAFAAAAALATGVLVTLIPALHTTRESSLRGMKEAGRTVSERRAGRLRRGLVGVQVALSTALLAVAGLLLHSFVNVTRVDAGFAVERVLAIDLSLPRSEYEPGRAVTFYHDLVERLASTRGVTRAAAISLLPIAHEGVIGTVLLETDTRVRGDRPAALRRSVTPALFAAMDIPLLAGRVFAEREPVPAAVISETLARRLWPGTPLSSVVGRRVRRDPAFPPTVVVGVVGDIRADSLDREPPSVVYHHYTDDVRHNMTLILRTAEDPRALASIVRAEVSRLDRNLPIAAMRTMSEIVSTSLAPRRFQMMLVAAMAVLALALSVVGIYGVASYAVTRRTREIGLRLALGAQRGDVVGSVLIDGLKPVAAGAFIGVAGGVLAAAGIRSTLFGIEPLDPLVLAGVTIALIAAATLACYVPARGAARMDPVAALKSE